MYVFGSEGVVGEGGEWMRGLGLGFTNPVRTGGVLDVCLCLDCGGVCGEWVVSFIRGVESRGERRGGDPPIRKVGGRTYVFAPPPNI